jgi:flagellar hook assembly protein FlgD
VYNLKGEEVRNLVSGTYRAGYHAIRWNGTNQDSEPVASGVYIYMLEAGTFHSVKKMLLMK